MILTILLGFFMNNGDIEYNKYRKMLEQVKSGFNTEQPVEMEESEQMQAPEQSSDMAMEVNREPAKAKEYAPSDNFLQGLTEREDFRKSPYDDRTGKALDALQLQSDNFVGKPTVGIGRLLSPEEYTSGKISLGDKEIDIYNVSEEDAKFLAKEAPALKDSLNVIKKSEAKLNQEQVDSLLSFGYNVGPKAVKNVLETFKNEGPEKAAKRMMEYVKVTDRKTGKKKVMSGLVKRREEEAAPFLASATVDNMKKSLSEGQNIPLGNYPQMASYGDENDIAEIAEGLRDVRDPFQKPDDPSGRSPAFSGSASVKDPLQMLLEKARSIGDRRDKQDMLNAIGQIASGFSTAAYGSAGAEGRGFAGAPIQAPKVDLGADARLKDLMAQYKSIAATRPLGIKRYQTASGIVEVDSEGNVKQLFEDPLTQLRADISRSRLEQGEKRLDLRDRAETRREDQFSYKKAEKFEDDVQKEYDRLVKSETYKEAKSMNNTIRRIRPIIDAAKEGNENALSMLGPMVAKGLAGEKGVLTEADVVRYVQSASVGRKLYDKYLKATEGKLSNMVSSDLIELTDIMEEQSKKIMQEQIGKRASQLSKIEGISKQDATYFLDDRINPLLQNEQIKGIEDSPGLSTPSQEEKVTVQGPDGKKSRLPKRQLDLAISRGYTLVEE